MAEIPEDVFISDILPQIPLKSMARFRCVSKLWHSWLSNPQFMKARIHDSLESIILQQAFQAGPCYISNVATKSCINDGNNFVMNKLIYPFTETDNMVYVEGSCHGLVLLSQYTNYHRRLSKVLTNPITLKVEEVINYPSSEWAEHCGLGYDSLNDDYKIVTLTRQSTNSTDYVVEVYSVKAKTWKRVEDSKYNYVNPIIGRRSRDEPGMFVNGCIHWRVYEPDNAISSFSLVREEFKIVHPPSELHETEFHETDFIVLGGCLTLVLHKPDCRSVDVWMMKEYGVQDSWMKFTIPSPRLNIVEVVCCLGDDEILIVYDYKQLMVYNMGNKDLKDVGVVGIPEGTDFSLSTFTPTLVSPSYNQSEAHKNTS